MPCDTQPSTTRRWTRRGLLIATAASVPLATLSWRFFPKRSPQLQLSTWRPLQPDAAVSFTPLDGSDEPITDKTVEVLADRSVRINAVGDTLIPLGQPVQGQFALDVVFTTKPSFERLGLFFKYRPRKDESSVAHPFQVIELAPAETAGYRLLWSYYCFFEQSDGTYRRETTSWAETPIDFAPQGAGGQLQVTLGKAGFPEVLWNNRLLSQAHWTLSWRARLMSQQTDEELKHAYLGRLGIFARSSSAVFTRLQLRYLDEREMV